MQPTSNRFRRRRVALAAGVVALLGASACGSSATSSSGSSTSSGASSTSPGGSSAKGSPLTIMLAAPGESNFYGLGNLPDGANAAIESINASGGVDGHPIKMVTCDTGQPIGNPQGSGACGRAAVSGGVLAVVGTESTYAGPLFTYLTRASIPSISPLDSSADNIQNTSPLSWVIEPSSISVPVSDIIALGYAGCKKIGNIYQSTNNTADTQGTAFAEAGAKSVGAALVRLPVSPTVTDFAPVIAQAESAGVDCIDQELPSTDLNPILTAINDSGKHMMVGSTIAIDSPPVLKSLGSAANGIVVADPFYAPGTHSSPAAQDFAKYEPSTPQNIIQLGNWESVEIFAAAAKKAIADGKPLTAASIQQELGTLSNVTYGLQPSLDLTKPGTFPGEPRVFSHVNYVYRYENGTFTPVTSQPDDPATAVTKYAPNAA